MRVSEIRVKQIRVNQGLGVPTDGVPISSNQPIFGILGQTKLMQI